MFNAAYLFMELRDKQVEGSDDYGLYEALRRLASNVEEIGNKIQRIEQKVNTLQR